jgi:salicylate hydroxylase
LALSQAGFDITLYERSEGLEEFGAGLQLTPNATRVLSRLEVLESVRALATRPSAVCAFRGSDDLVLTRVPVADAERRWGAPYLAIHRADLQRALAEAVLRHPNVELRFGTSVGDIAIHRERITIGVMRGLATMQDSADLLIGADGLRSRVRERFGLGEADKPAFAGRVAFRATVGAPRIDSRWMQQEVCVRIGPNAHLVHYPLRGGSILNLVAVIESAWLGAVDDRPWDGVADRRALDRPFSRWSKATHDLLAAAGRWRAWPLYCRPPIASFSLGRMALLGDAAHPMAPFLAQGAAQAIEDAGALKRIFLQTESVPDGLTAYSRERVGRAARIQIEAQRQGRIYHLDGPLAFARDAIIKLLGPDRLSSRYDWLYGA